MWAKCPRMLSRVWLSAGSSAPRTIRRTSRGHSHVLLEARDPADTATRDSIRGHFAHIAHAFSTGDFHLPMFIHDRMPPGAETMKRLRKEISYRTEDTERGARIVLQTRNPEAIAAIHDFLRFQIADHRTGDSPEVQR